MPRVTRRSLAAAEGKEEKPEPQPTRSKGRRGAKNAEPEDTGSVDEPQETPAKQGRRGAKVKETPPKVEATKGRGASRSTGRGRSKAETEPPEEDEEEEVEEKEEAAPAKRGARGRGKGGKGRGRSTGRGSRAKVVEDEEEEDEEMEEDDSVKSVEEAKPASGGRGRGRSKANTEEVTTPAKEVEEEKTPMGRQRKTPTKAPEQTPPSSGKRRSGRRGQVEEEEEVVPQVEKGATPKKTPDKKTPERSSRKKTESPAEVKKAEAMEADDTPQVAGTSQVSSQKIEKEEGGVGQKRRLEEEESESSQKRAKLSDGSSVAPAVKAPKDVPEVSEDDLTDFVVVAKEDVPAADSKEVTDSLPPPKKVEEKATDVTTSVEESKKEPPKEEKVEEVEEPMEVEKPEKIETVQEEAAKSESKQIEAKSDDDSPSQSKSDEPTAPTIPVVVPLTEAELAKQYNPAVRDRDETSSTMVEVGSEAASDIMSTTRNLDISDAVSMDTTISEQTNDETSNISSVSEQVLTEKKVDVPVEKEDVPVITQTAASSIVEVAHNSLSEIPLPAQTSETAPAPVVNSTTPQQPTPDVSLNSIPLPPTSNVSSSSGPLSGILPPGPPPPSSLATTPTIPTNHTNDTNSTQNGNVKSDGSEQSALLHDTSIPAKQPVFASLEGYVPSSTTYEKRKFMINSNFPIELFDTAFCFSVVSYNILADVHMRRNDYSYTEPTYLDQSYRHNLLTKEIEYLDGDIVCLQEVNPAYYNDVLAPFMKSKGYQGMFMKRTKDFYDEGEATFVKSSKFEIVSHQGLSLRDLAYKEIDSGGLSEEVSRAAKEYLDRAEVIVISKLLSKKTGKTLTVCNIHAVWAMQSPDLSSIQVASAIKELVSMAGSDLNPYIICGDFNSEVTSPAYHLVKEGYLSDAHIRSLQAMEKMNNTDGSSRSLINHLWRAFQHTSSNLKSAYETAVGKEPGLTSFTKGMHAAVDYIFYSASSLYTVGALEVVDQQVLEATGGLPSKDFPSDHVSMKAVFRLKD